MTPRTTLGICLLAFGLVSLRTVAAREGDTQIFTRSIYLSVRFALCPNLDEGTLHEGREAIARLPSRRIYQFTYYSDKKRIVPESYEVDVTMPDTAKPGILRTSLTISLAGVRIGERLIYRTSRKEVKRKLKHKRDVRLEEAEVLIHCTETKHAHWTVRHPTVLALSPDAIQSLLDYDWAGNVRELENIIERSVVLADGAVINERLIPEHVRSGPSFRLPNVVVPEEGISFRDVIHSFEKRLIRIEPRNVQRAPEEGGGAARPEAHYAQ